MSDSGIKPDSGYVIRMTNCDKGVIDGGRCKGGKVSKGQKMNEGGNSQYSSLKGIHLSALIVWQTKLASVFNPHGSSMAS